MLKTPGAVTSYGCNAGARSHYVSSIPQSMSPAFHKVTVAGSFLLYATTTVLGGLLHPILSQHQACALAPQTYAACCQLHVHSASDGQPAAVNCPVASLAPSPAVCLFCQLLATPQLCYFGTSFDRSDDVLDESLSPVAINQPRQQTSEYHSRAPPRASS